MLLTESFTTDMASQHYGTSDVAEKVMRRIEIAKVARNLQDCLAFASFKAQNGWQDRTLRSIEPEVAEQLKRKRPYSEEMNTDDSEQFPPSHLRRSNTGTFKVPDLAYTSSRKRIRSTSVTATDKSVHFSGNWKQDYGLAQSSPVLNRTHSEGFETALIRPEIEDSPMFDVHSDDDDAMGHELSSSIISSSPPRTPPPNHRRLGPSKQSGADLLLYLANSPSRSPAVNITHISSSSKPPSTPPSQHAHLPCSVMNLTPGPAFNLADFCNVTPSPAQAAWDRTPGPSKTPNRLTRRSLNYDQPPTSHGHGLALQLGEELPRS